MIFQMNELALVNLLSHNDADKTILHARIRLSDLGRKEFKGNFSEALLLEDWLDFDETSRFVFIV